MTTNPQQTHDEWAAGPPRALRSRPRSSRKGCLWAVIVFLVLCIVVLVVGVIGSLAMRSSIKPRFKAGIGGRKLGADEFPHMEEVWASGGGETKVVTVPLRGMILLEESNGGLFSTVSPAQIALMSIKRATHDPKVRGLILEVDSGGGGITASDVLYKALLDFREAAPDRRIVAVFYDVAASGAYYVSLAADHIVAHPTSITGSIGVLMQSLNAKSLAEKIGIKDVTIKSGENKDMLNPFDEVSQEQVALLQGMIDDMHDRFIGLVADERELPLEQVRMLADGRIYTSQQALDLGLIDEIGYWEDAQAAAAGLLGVAQVKVYRYEQAGGLSALFRSAAGLDPLRSVLERSSRPRLMYLWQP